MVLHMGFLNTPYNAASRAAPMAFAKKHEKQPRKHFTRTMTAEKVANILEGKYKVVQIFTQTHDEDIQEILTEAFKGAIKDTLSQRRKFVSDRMVQFMKPKTTEIEKLFRTFLDREETGISVEAAEKGNRTGRKSKTPRPPFINTGLYRASFRCWADIR